MLAVTDPSNSSKHKRHSLILVDPKTKGVNVVRPLTVFGYDDAPEGHCEVIYDGVQVDVTSGIVGGRQGLGRGFEVCPQSRKCVIGLMIKQIIQARLGYVKSLAVAD